jgi:hypothetical protein
MRPSRKLLPGFVSFPSRLVLTAGEIFDWPSVTIEAHVASAKPKRKRHRPQNFELRPSAVIATIAANV